MHTDDNALKEKKSSKLASKASVLRILTTIWFG